MGVARVAAVEVRSGVTTFVIVMEYVHAFTHANEVEVVHEWQEWGLAHEEVVDLLHRGELLRLRECGLHALGERVDLRVVVAAAAADPPVFGPRGWSDDPGP